jgi:hypothetical protein
MNERIKELWEEATVSSWPRPGKFTAGEYDYHLKKFAELIVRECSKVNNQYIGWRISDIDLDIVYKEHFGVEE